MRSVLSALAALAAAVIVNRAARAAEAAASPTACTSTVSSSPLLASALRTRRPVCGPTVHYRAHRSFSRDESVR